MLQNNNYQAFPRVALQLVWIEDTDRKDELKLLLGGLGSNSRLLLDRKGTDNASMERSLL